MRKNRRHARAHRQLVGDIRTWGWSGLLRLPENEDERPRSCSEPTGCAGARPNPAAAALRPTEVAGGVTREAAARTGSRRARRRRRGCVDVGGEGAVDAGSPIPAQTSVIIGTLEHHQVIVGGPTSAMYHVVRPSRTLDGDGKPATLAAYLERRAHYIGCVTTGAPTVLTAPLPTHRRSASPMRPDGPLITPALRLPPAILGAGRISAWPAGTIRRPCSRLFEDVASPISP